LRVCCVGRWRWCAETCTARARGRRRMRAVRRLWRRRLRGWRKTERMAME
jgi:hypothetical protein